MDGFDSKGFSNSGPGWLLDSQGMILPHSILGDLETFRSYVEARGASEVLKIIPNPSNQFNIFKKAKSNDQNKKCHGEVPSCMQTNALEHWKTHMKLRRRQQDSLSGLLCRPAENLLMNHADRFRETQEKREILNQVLPLVRSGYGHRVASGFWRLPQRYGDETSGIISTLTKSERGVREPTAQIGLPSSIRQESGLKEADTVSDASRAWNQSTYLKEQCQMLGEVIQDLDFKRADVHKLEVIGSSKPFCAEGPFNVSPKDTTIEDPVDLHDLVTPLRDAMKSNNVEPESKHLPVPALRISGKLAKWTGNSNANKNPSDQGHVGINTTLWFESPNGECQMSHIELCNEGCTAIFYSWEQLPLPHFPRLLPRKKKAHFHFSSSGVILPGETLKVVCSFQSAGPGSETELWQLNTHPVLLQGAPIQVTLRGMGRLDRTADHLQDIGRKLEKKITVKICRSIVSEVLRGIQSPERPSSVTETEEQEFLRKNPKIYYKNQPVEELKKLWKNIETDRAWDMCVSTLRQALLSLPDEETEDNVLNQEAGLAQLNSLLLQLTEPSPELQRPTAAALGKLLWRDLVDTMTSEAVRLTHLLHLPEKDTWRDGDENEMEEVSTEREKKASSKPIPKFSATTNVVKPKKEVAPVKHQDKKKAKGRRSDTASSGKPRHNESNQQLQEQIPQDVPSDTKMTSIYTRILHQKVYGLLENLVDSLCDVTEDLKPPADNTLPY